MLTCHNPLMQDPSVSIVVIVFELTGALSHVLPIMVSVMTSKFVGDALGKQGIYSAWIALRNYPWLTQTEFRDHGETARDLMKPLRKLVAIRDAEILVQQMGECLCSILLGSCYSRKPRRGHPERQHILWLSCCW